MNLIDAKIQNYSKTRYLHVRVRLVNVCLGAKKTTKKQNQMKKKGKSLGRWRRWACAGAKTPDVKAAELLLVSDRASSSFFLPKIGTKRNFSSNGIILPMRGYNSLPARRCSTTPPLCCPSRIRSWRNPGLLCPL